MEPGTRRLPLVVALAALAVQAPLAVLDLSIYYPDEIFQLLEPAHRAAFGYGQVAWEWRDGVRSLSLIHI